MTLEGLSTLLETSGYPVAYDHFISPQTAPFVCYLTSGASVFAADGKTYYSSPMVQVELYTKLKDLSAEEKLESVLEDFSWSKSEGYLQDVDLYLVTYTLPI